MNRVLLVSAAVIMTTISGSAPAISDQAIAEALFPEWVTAHSRIFPRDDGGPDVRIVHTLRADLDGLGRANYILATHSNGELNSLSVIDGSAQAPREVANTEGIRMFGFDAVPELVDFENDGRPEIVVSFRANKGSLTWVFRWTGSTLIPLIPGGLQEGVHPDSFLSDPDFVDFDGDGKLSIIDTRIFPEGEPAPLYRLSETGLEQSSSFLYYALFGRSSGEPRVDTRSFHLPSRNGGFRLRIVNGKRGAEMVESAVLSLNGATVVSRESFSNGVRLIDVPVSALGGENKLTVTVHGKPNGVLSVFVIPE